ncbi:MAG: NUDIX hydrolase [Xanthomonadales bacterium]|nr:NUDIX hydrolase [Xanthomonadales bacterium]
MTEQRTHFRGRYLAIAERDDWEFATRTNASAVAVLVAVTDAGEIILVEQHRIPVRGRTIELPAGLVGDLDDPEESIITAAARELEEETGYRAGRLEPLLTCPSSAGMSDEMITFLLAEELTRTGPGGGDDSEDITVHRVPLDQASEWLAEQRALGRQLDPKIYSALYWLDRIAAGKPPLG